MASVRGGGCARGRSRTSGAHDPYHAHFGRTRFAPDRARERPPRTSARAVRSSRPREDVRATRGAQRSAREHAHRCRENVSSGSARTERKGPALTGAGPIFPHSGCSSSPGLARAPRGCSSPAVRCAGHRTVPLTQLIPEPRQASVGRRGRTRAGSIATSARPGDTAVRRSSASTPSSAPGPLHGRDAR